MSDNYTPLYSEVLSKLSKIKSKKDKVSHLKHYNDSSLRMIIKSSFDPKIKWSLPEGEVPYKKNDAPEGTEHSNLSYEARKLFHYIEGGNPKLTQNKRESMFIQLLEALHPDEADILMQSMNKHRNWVQCSKHYKIGNIKGEANPYTGKEDLTRDATKKFLALGKNNTPY